MKFVRFLTQDQIRLGVLTAREDGVLCLTSILGGREFSDVPEFLEKMTERDIGLLREAVYHYKKPDFRLEEVCLCAPMERPVHDILCVGVNYKEHREETKEKIGGGEVPGTVYFSKRASRILGPGEAVQSRLDLDEQLDYEVELAIIIGKKGRDIAKEQAEDYIFGYSVFNDISSRSIQKQHGQWFRGKSLDTYAAMGPVILHKSALPFPVEVDVKSSVNGEERQYSNTRFFLTNIPDLIAELSSGMTLVPGDIIATGTPAGVGMGFSPPRYMRKGDKVVCEIPQIGKLENEIK